MFILRELAGDSGFSDEGREAANRVNKKLYNAYRTCVNPGPKRYCGECKTQASVYWNQFNEADQCHNCGAIANVLEDSEVSPLTT